MDIAIPQVDGVRGYTLDELNGARDAVIAMRDASLTSPLHIEWAIPLSVAIAFLSAVRDGMENHDAPT